MPVEDFSVFVDETKTEFGELIKRCDENSIEMREFLRSVFSQLTTEFEVETVIENFKEMLE